MTATMTMFTLLHLCQGVANDDIQLPIVDKNLAFVTDDADKNTDATDDAVDCDAVLRQ